MPDHERESVLHHRLVSRVRSVQLLLPKIDIDQTETETDRIHQ